MEMTYEQWSNLLLILFVICVAALFIHDLTTNPSSSRNRNVKYKSSKGEQHGA